MIKKTVALLLYWIVALTCQNTEMIDATRLYQDTILDFVSVLNQRNSMIENYSFLHMIIENRTNFSSNYLFV